MNPSNCLWVFIIHAACRYELFFCTFPLFLPREIFLQKEEIECVTSTQMEMATGGCFQKTFIWISQFLLNTYLLSKLSIAPVTFPSLRCQRFTWQSTWMGAIVQYETLPLEVKALHGTLSTTEKGGTIIWTHVNTQMSYRCNTICVLLQFSVYCPFIS